MHTKDQRDKHDLCGARKKNGEACRKFAGEGTPHPGIGRCKYHGGCVPNHIKHAVKVEAQQRAIQFGERIDIEPTEALLAVLHLSCGHLEFIRTELAARSDESSFERDVLMRMYDDERDRVARIAKGALDAGVAERQVRLAERYGEQLARVIQGVFSDPELALTAEQQATLPGLLRRHLVAADTGATRPLSLAPPASRS